MSVICKRTLKQMFSHGRARRVAQRMNRKRKGARVSFYKCEHCGAWHVGEASWDSAGSARSMKRSRLLPFPDHQKRGD